MQRHGLTDGEWTTAPAPRPGPTASTSSTAPGSRAGATCSPTSAEAPTGPYLGGDAVYGFEDLDSNASGDLDDGDEHVAVRSVTFGDRTADSTVIDVSSLQGEAPGTATVTFLGLTDLSAGDFLARGPGRRVRPPALCGKSRPPPAGRVIPRADRPACRRRPGWPSSPQGTGEHGR